MALTRETTTKVPGFNIGDIKVALYDITFTANQLVEPSQDPGFFLLNGAVCSQTTYPKLFARYGTTYNTGGEGAGNFRLPDWTEGKIPVGRGLTNFTTFAATGGEINHALSSGEIVSHTHGNTFSIGSSAHSHSIGGSSDFFSGHAHGYNTVGGSTTMPSGGGTGVNGTSFQFVASPDGGHSHSVGAFSSDTQTETTSKSGSISSAGSGTAHNNMMPYLVVGGILVKHD